MPEHQRNPHEQNGLLAEREYNSRKLRLESKPRVFAIEGTNHCNIRCVMCPRGEPDLMRRPLGHMSNDLLNRVIEKADYFTQPAWFHWFGEPLMNPNLFAQIAIAKRKVPNLGISTNATLLHEENQRRILESELDSIMIAIDGASKEVYERVRKSVRFTFEAVCANAESFLARRRSLGFEKPRVTLSIIVMDETAADLENFKKHWLQHGADEVLFKPFTNWGGQSSASFDNLEIADRRARLASPRAHPCKHLWESMVVTWDGRVVPCCFDFDAKMVMGDLNTDTMEEIWNGPAYVELRRAEREGRNRSALCANCSQAPGHAPVPDTPESAAVAEISRSPQGSNVDSSRRVWLQQFKARIFGRG